MGGRRTGKRVGAMVCVLCVGVGVGVGVGVDRLAPREPARTFWGIVGQLVDAGPLIPEAVQRIVGARMTSAAVGADDRNDITCTGGPVGLIDGRVISQAVWHQADSFLYVSSMSLRLGGACVSQIEVKARYRQIVRFAHSLVHHPELGAASRTSSTWASASVTAGA